VLCLYRTGDIGRITPAGEIEYLGPIEAPVKSLGYRIEQGEIALVALPLEYAPAPQGTGAISKLADETTSRLEPLKRWKLKNIYHNVLTDPLYRNSLLTMASTFILGGLGFVFWVIIAQLYRTEDVGIATTLISLMTLLSSFTILGLNVSLNRYLPKSAHKSELINSSFVVVTIVAIFVSVIFLLGLQLFSPQLTFLQSNIFYIISFTIFLIFFSWNILVDNVFIAFRSAGGIFIKNSVISILKVFLPLALTVFGAYGIFLSNSSAFAIGVIIAIIILFLNFKIRPSMSVNIPLLNETLVYSFANYIAEFSFNMPSLVLPVIILNVLSAKFAAYYYVASMLQSFLQVIPLATAQSLLTEGSYSVDDLKKHVKKAIVTILIVLIPAITIIVFGGNILLQFFGKSYASEAFQFLQLYSISTIFTAIILISNAVMNVKHQVKMLVILNVIASFLTLGLSYAFISGSLVGIGWGWMLGQAIAGLLSLFFITYNLYRRER
jgi:O-antigen/teichoic acid export membrane protein